MKYDEFRSIRVCKECGGITRLGRAINDENSRGRVGVSGIRHCDSADDLIWVLKCINCGYSISPSEPIRDLRQVSRLMMREFFDGKDAEQDREIVSMMAESIITNIHGEPVVPIFDDKNFGVIAIDTRVDSDT